MSEIVFILGAGTSAEAGAPLIKGFLRKAEELRTDNRVGRFKDDFDLLDRAVGELQLLLPKTYVNLDDIETVFGLFEMGKLLGGFLAKSEEDIDKLLVSIRNVILATLEQTLVFRGVDGNIRPMPYHETFARLVHALHVERKRKCSILTFNYDLALDFALHNMAVIPIDYCLSEKIERGRVPFMKLHGSLNWGACSKCGTVIPWHLSEFFAKVGVNTNSQKLFLHVGSMLSQSGLTHCESAIDNTPVIVPPTWNKTAYSRPLGQVWRHAARELSDAEYVFVSGYSLNPIDSFFRHLLALGLCGTGRLRQFQVFDIDAQVAGRFKELVGTGVSEFNPSQMQFSAAIPLIGHALRLPNEVLDELNKGLVAQQGIRSQTETADRRVFFGG